MPLNPPAALPVSIGCGTDELMYLICGSLVTHQYTRHVDGRSTALLILLPSCGVFSHDASHSSGTSSGIQSDPGTSNAIGAWGGVLSNVQPTA